MPEPYTCVLDDDDDSAGIHRRSVATALLTWIGMNGGRRSMVEACMTFNTTPQIINQAIADSYWLFPNWPNTETDPTKQIIETDGE